MAPAAHCFGPFEAIIITIRPHNLSELFALGKATEVFEAYAEFVPKAAAIVEAHEGVFFNLEDGSIMAAWGLEGSQPDDALNAVGACLALREELVKFNRIKSTAGKTPMVLGMGLDAGEVIVTSRPSADGSDAIAVIGDAVNGANAIEALTADLRADALISSKVAGWVSKDFVFENVGSHDELQYVSGIYDETGSPVRVNTMYKPTKNAPPPAQAVEESTPPCGTSLPAGEGNFIDPEILNQASLPDHWFVKVGQDVRGPLSRDEIVVALKTGELTPETFACSDMNSPSWSPLGDIPEFREALGAKAA